MLSCVMCRWTCFSFVVALWPALACAQAPIGYVKTLSGEAYMTQAGKTTKVEIGTPVMAQVKFVTLAKSSLGITLRDETMLGFGPFSEWHINEFQYVPSQERLKLDLRLTKGTMNFISGMITKLQPNGTSISTPHSVMGVRGTQFLVSAEE